MKAILPAGRLAAALRDAAAVTPARPANPVLAAIHITAAKDQLTLAAYDYDTAITLTVEADIHTPGDTWLAGRHAASLAATLSGGDATFTADHTRATMSAPQRRYTLPVLDGRDAPQHPTPPPDRGTINADLLRDAVKLVALAANDTHKLPALECIRLEAEGTDLHLAATNRYGLHWHRLPWDGPAWTGLVHADQLEAATNTIEDEITIGADDNLLALTSKTRHVTLRQFDATFPKWRSLFLDNDASVAVDTGELLDALKAATLAGADKNIPVRLQLGDGQLRYSVVNEGGNDEDAALDGTLTADVKGDMPPSGYNPRYLGDAVRSIGAERVNLRPASNPGKPMRIESDEQPHRHALVMPIRLGGKK